jgi:integrase
MVFRNPTRGIRGVKAPKPIWALLRPDDLAASVAAATTVQARLYVVLAAVYAARPGQIRALHLDDVDLAARRITIAGNSRPLDDLTTQVLLDWLTYRRERWPRTANRHLLISSASALNHSSVSHAWILNLRGLTGTLERLRIDRQLEEALTTGADPLHLAAVFGFSDDTAIRWATNARELIGDPHATRLPESP